MALRDFYVEQAKKSRDEADAKIASARDEVKQGSQDEMQVQDTSSTIVDRDFWALEYITIQRVQPIMEALDDDASGFVTIAEVNDFTSARPPDWP
jgi:hypothetical protein